jgi:hypothetical protein
VSDADAAALLARRESPIVLDRAGRFLHAGTPIEHPGIIRAFRRWVARGPGGRFVLQASEREWAFITVEGAATWVEEVAIEGESLRVRLWDDTRETVDAATLRLDAAGVLHATARDLPAQFSRHAQLTLGQHLEPTPGGGWELPLGATRVRLGDGAR